MVVRHVAERIDAGSRPADRKIAVVRGDRLLVRDHRVVVAADPRIDVRGHVHQVTGAGQQLAQRVSRGDALRRIGRGLDRVHVQMQGAGMLRIALR